MEITPDYIIVAIIAVLLLFGFMPMIMARVIGIIITVGVVILASPLLVPLTIIGFIIDPSAMKRYLFGLPPEDDYEW